MKIHLLLLLKHVIFCLSVTFFRTHRLLLYGSNTVQTDEDLFCAGRHRLVFEMEIHEIGLEVECW